MFRKARSNAFFVEEGREEGYIVEMHLSIPPVVEDGPGRSRVSSFPRGGQLFKRGRRGGRERPKNPKAKRTESVAKRWEAESGRRGEEGARRQNEKFSDWQRRTGGSAWAPRGDRFESVRGRIGRRRGREGRGGEKRRREEKKKRKERKKEEKKNEEKEGKRKRSTHYHPLGFDETHACDPMAFHTAILSSDPSSPRFPSHLLIPAESFSCSPLFSSFLPGSNDVIY